MASIDPPPDESKGPAKDYGSWSLTELKEELRRRNAKLTGKKAQLVQRLIDYDQLFGNIINNPESCYKLTEPEAQEYLDLNSDSLVPSLNNDDLERFTVLTEREDVLTASNLYKEGFLLTCRLAYESQEDAYFINSICSSEMRKNISYRITIKLNDHIILETQCECAAGMGPYAQCKHVIPVIYAIIDFTTSKKIIINRTCTSKLQTFHQPNKIYTGNPVKAEDLVLRANNTNLNKIATFDPRPSETNFKRLGIPPSENYENDFRNLIINFSASNNSSMPIRHLYQIADKKAFYQDHDYLKKTAAEEFIDGEQISVPQIKVLEVKTRNKKVWKKERLRRLQSSEFGRICKSMEQSRKKLARSLLKF
ncbi:hypothetical protein O0L34_g19064 [Tuta absoluta]|nr:hypothetical protein O0L34_g19064 [Tuta absoluta]